MTNTNTAMHLAALTADPWSLIPIAVTIICLFLIFRKDAHEYDGIAVLFVLFRLLWLIPVLLAWTVYLAVRLWLS